MLKSISIGTAMLLASTFAAHAQSQTVIDGNATDEILNIARGYGSAALETQSTGNPKISGRIEGVAYQVFFLNCTDNVNCEDLNFYAGFLDNKQTLEAINAWNRDKRFGRAYLDGDLDAVIEFDVNLQDGVTRDNVDANFAVWSLILGQYKEYIGFKGSD